MPLMPKIINQPLMIEMNYLNAMIAAKTDEIEKKAALYGKERKNYAVNKNNAIISIIGPLSQRMDFWSWWFGGTSYDSIRRDFGMALEDDDVESIIFDIDSPGGAVAGVFDLVDEISMARGQKKIIAMINERAYSAAYAIASAADEIYIPRTGGAGSIGVIAMHTDISKWEEKVGVKYTAIFAGARKNDFSPHEPLSQEAYEVVKAEIDTILDIFVDTMANNTKMDAEIIRTMEAGIYQGQKAVDIGLADDIKTMTEVINNKGGKIMSMSLTEAINAVIQDASPKEIAKAMNELGYIEKEGMITEADHKNKMEAQDKEFEKSIFKATETALAAGKEDAKKEIVAILELCSIGGVENMALKMVSDGISKDEAKDQIITAKVSTQTINSTVNSLHSGEVNPLIADAERRAKEAKA